MEVSLIENLEVLMERRKKSVKREREREKSLFSEIRARNCGIYRFDLINFAGAHRRNYVAYIQRTY